ncbi:DUF5916 domain-containing protein [Jiulongibacter sp. NS-SX5]|uniref:DUF5916 domain-containing protein n=1 Tax=Jiulongibacter sp. NS-SX5 TaxID=3463854 RepID=UPI00405A0EEB
MKYLNCIFLSAFLLNAFSSFAQDETPSIFVKYIGNESITLDASLDEPIWQSADIATDFWQFFPVDSVKAKNKTEVRMLQSDEVLYVGIKAESAEGDFIVNSLRRDFSGTTNDNVSLIFDTFNDATNAFMFSANPMGVQRETLISGGGSARDGFNTTWDIKWQSEGKIYDNYYILEIAIPFSSLKFPEGSKTWRFQSYRWDLQTNEQSAWSRVPQQQMLVNLAFLGEMTFEKPLGQSKAPVYLIPYINAIASKDYNTGQPNNKVTVGGDAKIAIGNGMNLDITVNPDFSNVEVDNVVTNLTRFEVNFPEKRQFFIDNNDLFANFGNSFNEARPFFSRRIGIVRDSAGNNIENRILGGVRLSGKVNQNWRLGVLSIQTAEDRENGVPSNNNSMIAVQRKVFARSNIGAFVVNRQTVGNYDFVDPNNRYNRVAGIDYNLASADSKWTGKFYYHKSFQPDDTKGNASAQATITFNNRFWTIIHDWVYIDQDFKSDLGFIPRRGLLKSGNGIARTFYNTKGAINKQTSRIVNVLYFSPVLNYKRTDQFVRLSHNIEFRNQSTLGFTLNKQYIFLQRSFDPTRSGGEPLPGEKDYRFTSLITTYATNNSGMVTFEGTSTIGQFFNGKQYSAGGTATVRFMPKTLISLLVDYNHISLPKPHATADIWLVSPKFDITFTKSVFWSTLVQYSNQRKNLGVQSRLQWRFAPLSDLFLVYNDNYTTNLWEPTYRSINLKFTYWLNL